MKEIWINLELYFKRYDFYNFRDFFWIFSDFSNYIFYLKTVFKLNKKIKIRKKGARDPRGCDVARKATWQRHADPRSAYVAHTYYYIIIIIYIVKGVFSLA